MKRNVSVILSAFVLLLSGRQGILADPISYTDLWDVSQGTVVTDYSVVHPISNIANMFGHSVFDPRYGEGENTLFVDGEPAGFTHWVEWQTASPILINSFNLVASHDGANTDYRAFQSFGLYGWTGTAWDPLYSCDVSNPYGGGETYTETYQLELYDTFSAVTSQKFRAEFVQYSSAGGRVASGPRIHELDGYYDVQAVPTPTAVVLGLLGLGAAGAKLRRKRNI